MESLDHLTSKELVTIILFVVSFIISLIATLAKKQLDSIAEKQDLFLKKIESLTYEIKDLNEAIVSMKLDINSVESQTENIQEDLKESKNLSDKVNSQVSRIEILEKSMLALSQLIFDKI